MVSEAPANPCPRWAFRAVRTEPSAAQTVKNLDLVLCITIDSSLESSSSGNAWSTAQSEWANAHPTGTFRLNDCHFHIWKRIIYHWIIDRSWYLFKVRRIAFCDILWMAVVLLWKFIQLYLNGILHRFWDELLIIRIMLLSIAYISLTSLETCFENILINYNSVSSTIFNIHYGFMRNLLFLLRLK